MKNLTTEELILKFKEHKCSLRETEKEFNASKNSLMKLFVKRGVDYNKIKELYLKSLEDEYYKNPKRCLNCGKPISYEDPDRNRKKFCSSSCAASYNNKHKTRIVSEETKHKISEGLKYSNSVKNRLFKQYKIYYCKVCGNPFTMKDMRDVTGRVYCSKDCKHKYLSEHTGGYREGCGRGKHGWYKGIYCDSSWELAFVIYHLDHNIPIQRCTEIRKYIYHDIEYEYHPDFIVNNEIIEIKGYDSELWHAKCHYNPDVKVLYKEDMNFYLKYVHDKYGYDFINMYDSSNPKNDLNNKEFLWLNNTQYNIFVTIEESILFLNKGWVKGRINKEITKEIILNFINNYEKKDCFNILGIKRKRLNSLIKQFNL